MRTLGVALRVYIHTGVCTCCGYNTLGQVLNTGLRVQRTLGQVALGQGFTYDVYYDDVMTYGLDIGSRR